MPVSRGPINKLLFERALEAAKPFLGFMYPLFCFSGTSFRLGECCLRSANVFLYSPELGQGSLDQSFGALRHFIHAPFSRATKFRSLVN